MSLKNQIDALAEKLRTERDGLLVQMHLASMEIKDEWDQSEQQWEKLKTNLADIGDETKEVTEELAAATIVIGEELGQAYQRIVERLKK